MHLSLIYWKISFTRKLFWHHLDFPPSTRPYKRIKICTPTTQIPVNIKCQATLIPTTACVDSDRKPKYIYICCNIYVINLYICNIYIYRCRYIYRWIQTCGISRSWLFFCCCCWGGLFVCLLLFFAIKNSLTE